MLALLLPLPRSQLLLFLVYSPLPAFSKARQIPHLITCKGFLRIDKTWFRHFYPVRRYELPLICDPTPLFFSPPLPCPHWAGLALAANPALFLIQAADPFFSFQPGCILDKGKKPTLLRVRQAKVLVMYVRTTHTHQMALPGSFSNQLIE